MENNNVTAIAVSGTQPFMGKEIPIVLGGFGPNARCVCDKTVAEIHGQSERAIRKAVGRNISRFREMVDYIDLKRGGHPVTTSELLSILGYSTQMVIQAEHIYIFSERGYAKLVKIMDTDQAWDIYERLLDEYFLLRETVNDMMVLPKDYPSALRALADTAERNMALQAKIEQDAPKVLFADSVSESNDSCLIRELAKMIRQNGVDTGEKRLFEWMRDNGYLIRQRGTDYNMPTQRAMEMALFAITERTIRTPDGEVKVRRTPRVTGKGQQYFINMFLAQVKEDTA